MKTVEYGTVYVGKENKSILTQNYTKNRQDTPPSRDFIWLSSKGRGGPAKYLIHFDASAQITLRMVGTRRTFEVFDNARWTFPLTLSNLVSISKRSWFRTFLSVSSRYMERILRANWMFCRSIHRRNEWCAAGLSQVKNFVHALRVAYSLPGPPLFLEHRRV